MRILGIDPGFGIVGFGLIEYGKDRKFQHVAHGLIKTTIKAEFATRLVEISDDMKELLIKYKPEKVLVEQLFFSKNTTTAMRVAEARGVINLELSRFGLTPIDITPSQVKIGLTGSGNAQKSEVRKMVKKFLVREDLKGMDDAIDGLAIAIAGVNF